MLDIYAGKEAQHIIQEQGFSPELFTSFLGASGGPKWFTLFGLDKYLFGEFFKDRDSVLNLVGSSAGAFRSACFAQQDPVAAIQRLATHYAETVYSDDVTPQEITDKARVLLTQVFGPTGINEVINNPYFKAHFIVARSKGLVASENKALQLVGLVKSYALNRIDRRLLKNQYERFVFQSPSSELQFEDSAGFPTHHVDLTEANLEDALLASGSIPLVMSGIKDIADTPKGMYRDGGIIDYHFDILLKNSAGLTLYPHFTPKPKAGWFDKSLKRKVDPKNYSKTVMLVPSPRFIESLPYGKIPDRDDFKKMEPQQRIKYWKTVLSETERLAEHFNLFCLAAGTHHIKDIG